MVAKLINNFHRFTNLKVHYHIHKSKSLDRILRQINITQTLPPYLFKTYFTRGTRWRSWLRHCATSRKIAGLIPDGVIGSFHWHNPSGRTMALGLTQPLTEMSTRHISWG